MLTKHVLTFGRNNFPIKSLHYYIFISEDFVLRKNCSMFCIWMWQELFSASLPQRHFECSICILCSSVADCLDEVSSYCQLLCHSSWVLLCLGAVLIHNSRLFCWKVFSYVHCGSKTMFLLSGKLRSSLILHWF